MDSGAGSGTSIMAEGPRTALLGVQMPVGAHGGGGGASPAARGRRGFTDMALAAVLAHIPPSEITSFICDPAKFC